MTTAQAATTAPSSRPIATPQVGMRAVTLGQLATMSATAAMSAGKAFWTFLEACGRSRATREMLLVADTLQSQHPEAAARLRAAVKSSKR